ncbi:MAG: MFS transporter, partial [Clostridia bacterium]|nr:MFS transporter [Clostridia bacterium]
MQVTKDGKQKRFTKKEWSWIMYDWANSIYATNIMAAIFPTIFVSIAGEAGDIWWGYGTSIATFLVAILAPLLGAVADFKGMKKKLFTTFMLIGVVFTFMIAMVMNNWHLMLLCYILSRIGFSGSCLFYDSFLTDVTTDERMDKVSSWGYAMGYIGGSTIPFVISIAMLLMLGYSNPIAQKFSILIVSVWWLVFSIPFLKNVEQTHYIERTAENSVGQIFRNILHTAKDIFQRKGLFLFVVAYFFYIDGVGTIISISTAYGTVLGLGTVGMILALLVTQIVAMPCSILFANLAAKITARKALIGAIIVYTFICCVGFYMGFSLEPHQEAYETALKTDFSGQVSQFAPEADENMSGNLEGYNVMVEACEKAFRAKDPVSELAALRSSLEETPYYNRLSDERYTAAAIGVLDTADSFYAKNAQLADNLNKAVSFSTILFWAMATLVGTVQGGIQAVSRSYFGKLIPKERSNEFFGFFDIFGKFASVLGPVLYSTIGSWTGRSSFGVLALICLFLVGLVIMITGKKEL